jgi:hypothetical protein
MFHFWEQLRVDPIGAVSLPGWVVVAAVVLFIIVGGLGIMRGGAARIAVAFILAAPVAWALDHLAARDLAAEARALEARAFELRMHALSSASPLACLEATAGKIVQDACEKAIFASAETTAAAVSYVAAQLSLLAAGRKTGRTHERTGGSSYPSELTALLRAIESDRFGIVAHLFAMRPGCAPERCDLFAMLEDTSRVGANLAEQPFESYVNTHMAEWPAAGSRPLLSNSAPGSFAARPPLAAGRPSSKLFFPSSSSIPPVNIMTSEPAVAQQPQAQQPHETTASADPAARTRKPPPGTPPTRPPPTVESGQSRSSPLQIAPPPQ